MANCNTSEAGSGGGTMNTQTRLLDGSLACQTLQFKLVEK